MPGFPSGTNTFVPSIAASNSLIVGFSRNPRTFKVAQYCQYVPAKFRQGLYWRWTSRQGARILTANDAEHIWNDGDAAPVGPTESFDTKGFMTTRRCYGFILGGQAVEQADFELLAAQSAVSAQQAMTARTMLVHTALANATWGANTSAVDGGILPANQNWRTGSVGHPSTGATPEPGANIKKSLQYAAAIIHKQTIGVVTPAQLTLVINPITAMMMAASTEIQDYLKQSQFAAAQVRGDVPSLNGNWNLPDKLYGFNVAVEDAVRVSSNIGASTDSLDYILPNGVAYLLARQGDLMGIQGNRSYSTVQVFFYKNEMTVRTMYETQHERYVGQVISDFTPEVVAPQAGFRFTNIGEPVAA